MSSAHAKSLTLEQLKADLRSKHGLIQVSAETLQSSKAVSTGWPALDAFAEGGGFPCGKLSLLEGLEGQGALTLWLDTASRLTQQGHRVAWLNSSVEERESFQLHPPTAVSRGVDLQKLFLVDSPNRQKRSWILQELLASQLFSLVGCDLGEAHIPLRECRSLLMQARRSGAAVVLFSRRPDSRPDSRTDSARTPDPPPARALASLVLKFEFSDHAPKIEVLRASHRPVPHRLSTTQRGDRHVDFIINTSSITGSISRSLNSGFRSGTHAERDGAHPGLGD